LKEEEREREASLIKEGEKEKRRKNYG